MTDEIRSRIREYVEKHGVCTIAVSDGNTPSAHTVYYINRDLNIYFESDPHSSKVHVLRTNPKISLTIDEDYTDWTKIKGIQMFGRAKTIGEKSAPKVREAFEKKFPQIRELGGIPPHHVFFEVIPEKIYFLDFSKKFGHKSAYYPVKDRASEIDW